MGSHHAPPPQGVVVNPQPQQWEGARAGARPLPPQAPQGGMGDALSCMHHGDDGRQAGGGGGGTHSAHQFPRAQSMLLRGKWCGQGSGAHDSLAARRGLHPHTELQLGVADGEGGGRHPAGHRQVHQHRRLGRQNSRRQTGRMEARSKDAGNISQTRTRTTKHRTAQHRTHVTAPTERMQRRRLRQHLSPPLSQRRVGVPAEGDGDGGGGEGAAHTHPLLGPNAPVFRSFLAVHVRAPPSAALGAQGGGRKEPGRCLDLVQGSGGVGVLHGQGAGDGGTSHRDGPLKVGGRGQRRNRNSAHTIAPSRTCALNNHLCARPNTGDLAPHTHANRWPGERSTRDHPQGCTWPTQGTHSRDRRTSPWK